jgi:addiction module RelE/StbE family toxin
MAKVNWTFQALEDLEVIYEFVETYSPNYATFLIDHIFEKCFLLENFPRMGRVVPEVNIPSIRELIIKGYRVIYSVPNSGTVDVLAVRHSSVPLSEFNFPI